MAIPPSHSHSPSLLSSLSPCLLCTLPTHHILSIQASLLGLMVLLQLSCIRANYCCPQQAQSTSLSQSALLQLHTSVYFLFFGQENSSKKKHVREKKHTPFLLHSPIHGLLQIALLLANESLEGCTPQSLSSDAITASVASKSWVKPLP